MPHLLSQTTIMLLSCCSVLAQKAPEFVFPNFEFPDGTYLKDHSDKGVILVYGDSSCPACKKGQGHLKIRPKRWKEWGFPIVYMALDSDPQDLKQNFGIPPLGRSTVMASRGTALGSLRPIFMQSLPFMC